MFCDIVKERYTLDSEKIEPLITDKTCAVLPVHVYGNVCDTDSIKSIAAKHDLKVIYDAAHAFGVKVNGVGIGNFGDASMFSFHATKVFNTIEGGAVTHPDGELSDKLAWWRNFGIIGPEDVVYVGGNSKMNEFAAAMGLCNLRHVDEEIAKRRRVAERYWERLDAQCGVRVCQPPANVDYNYAYMPILIDPVDFGATRDDVYEALAQKGIVARKYFYPLTSDYECYRGIYDSNATPVAKLVASSVLTLPMYADLKFEDVDMVCNIVLGTRTLG